MSQRDTPTRLPTVGEIGERELIRRLQPYLQVGWNNTILGVGDDCAIIPDEANPSAVYTTDLLIEGTHFLVNPETQWDLIGHKAAVANLSDIAAMGAGPLGMLVSVGLPPSFPVDNLLALYKGMHAATQAAGAPIIGGDTTRAQHVTISITVIGRKAATDAKCLRSDARPGDYLYVSGCLGDARAGLNLILNPEAHKQFDFEMRQRLTSAHFQREPQLALGRTLASRFSRVAMIDISDGLYNEGSLLAQASNVQIQLNLDAIPVDELAQIYCNRLNLDPAEFALFSGEEYQLLFALPVRPDQLNEHLRQAGVECRVTHVGTVNPGSGVTLLKGGHPVQPPDQTFAHFRKEP